MEIEVKQKIYIIMKKNNVKRTVLCMAMMVVAMMSSLSAMAQAKVDDKEIIGVWIMKSMKFDGEDRELINEGYNQVKVYRANGEYACAEIVKDKNGKYVICPHEYGTYSLKNGMYSEMGRKAIKYNWVNKTTSKGRWMNRYDTWIKVNMPEKLVQHIVDKCKPTQPSNDEMQALMKKHIFQK